MREIVVHGCLEGNDHIFRLIFFIQEAKMKWKL
jgi:hypothetical protein